MEIRRLLAKRSVMLGLCVMTGFLLMISNSIFYGVDIRTVKNEKRLPQNTYNRTTNRRPVRMTARPAPKHPPKHPHIEYDHTLLAVELPVETNLPLNTTYQDNIFFHHDIHSPPVYQVKRDKRVYFKDIGNHTCFIEGTDFEQTTSAAGCRCLKAWYGTSCSVPEIIAKHSSPLINLNRLSIRKEARVVIQATPFNIEYEMLEARLGELGDIVDVFIICESNYTAYGDPKPLRLLDKLKKGYLIKHHDRMVYVFLPYFKKEAFTDGWIADKLPRDYMGLQGLKEQMSGYNQDDLIMYLDADEVPSREVMLFLKLHNGYPEPFGFQFWMTMYGFFWRHDMGVTKVLSGSTIGLLDSIFDYHVAWLREPLGEHFRENKKKVTAYEQRVGYRTRMWYIGDGGTSPNVRNTAGWHCTYCFTPEAMKVKMMSLINEDFPRWGDYPEKMKLPDIINRVMNGLWFDGAKEQFIPVNERFYPKSLEQYRKRFIYLFECIY